MGEVIELRPTPKLLNFCTVCHVRIEKDEAKDAVLEGTQHLTCPQIIWIPSTSPDSMGHTPQPFRSLEAAMRDCDERLRGTIVVPASDWRSYGSKAGMAFTTSYIRDINDPMYTEALLWQQVEAFRVK